jgi:hypothetical protein
MIGNGNDAPLTGLRLSSRNFDELLLASQMHVASRASRALRYEARQKGRWLWKQATDGIPDHSRTL